MTEQEKTNLVTNYFAEDWAIDEAMQLLEDCQKMTETQSPLSGAGGVQALSAAQQGGAYAALPDEGEPWRGHKFKEVQRGCWRCDCGKTIKEETSDQSTPASGGNYPVMPKRYTVDDDGEELFTAEKMRAFADATCALRASHGQAPSVEQQAQLGTVYAELPVPNYPKSGGFPGSFAEVQMRDFADRTHALRMQAAPKAAPVTQQAGYAEVIECGNSYAKVKLKGEAFGSTKVGDIFYTAPQPEHDLKDVPCACCGYMTHHREHMGCIRAAAPKAAPGELSADSLRHQNKLLAETLGACILASGIVRKDIDGFTGPELLHFGEDLRSMLEAAPQQEAQEPVGVVEHAQAQTSYIHWTAAPPPNGTKLYTAPQPAPAAQQAGEISDYLVLAITTAYEQGVGKGRQAYEAGKEISNPYSTGYRCDLAWAYGYDEGKKQATRMAAPQPSLAAQADSVPAPAPLSEPEYKRGYRDGYERRDAEVRGALV